jgi:hypothetical protein
MANHGLLSEHDLALLRLLHHTPATTPLLLKASSTFPGGAFRDERRVRERLQTLASFGLVRAFPGAQGVGAPVNWYKLTLEGFRTLHGGSRDPPHRSKFGATSPSRFEHTRVLAEVIVHIFVAAHDHHIAVPYFFGDGEQTIEGAGQSQRPDCFFRFAHCGRHFNIMFEVDQATEPLDSEAANALRQKILIYEAHQDSVWQWWKQSGRHAPRPYFRVAFLTTSMERAAHSLWLAQECARNSDRHLCYAASQELFLASKDPLQSPLFNDHHGRWQALVNVQPTSHFARTPIRLAPPMTTIGGW